ncbi:proline iminopeptidase-family hydrolase [Pseudomonas sp. Fl5BN2]|uniref:proline iminopeptidase-family hydrolase n=1 Tax=Pseudomonas sp. Fl5BN2 TaxID=2697652 RepID=UPI001377C641|nr:proline iminopeptidase-family hydrolase [Pseudomonas sp. Fl5BN2]NBF06146.1 proline iminopeptidase-family hydrolase [Pseudomonas sp. Fl5BN2]
MNASKPPQEGYASFGANKTWYRVTGDLQNGLTPLVILHGGPGCTYDTVDAFKDVAASGRAIIQFDHLGSGFSTRMVDKDPSFWTVELFLEELDNLLDHLRISQGYALLGHSWGGVLASEHAVLTPSGLRALIIANAPADMRTWEAETLRLREALPEEVRQVLIRHEQAGTLQSAESVQASQVYFERHVCRLRPWPEEVVQMFARGRCDSAMGGAAQRAEDFPLLGNLRDWSIVERLSRIQIPTLLISGRYDEATPTVVKPYLENIPDIRWALFESSSHMPHVEERVACMGTVVSFLDECL